jgi:hypothetical protein
MVILTVRKTTAAAGSLSADRCPKTPALGVGNGCCPGRFGGRLIWLDDCADGASVKPLAPAEAKAKDSALKPPKRQP